MKKPITRRDLIRQFGVSAFLLAPVLKSMRLMASTSFSTAPRFVMFFKGAGFQPIQVNSISNLSGTVIAPLQAHSSDIVLFRNMHIHGGGVQSTGYKEEHAAGLFGCTTGHQIHYSQGDAYYAYTDHQSIDVAIANHYKAGALANMPFPSLHIGAGAHSDADNVGLGQRYISFRNRRSGDSRYGNAIEPVQNVAQVYSELMARIQLICNRAAGLHDFRLDPGVRSSLTGQKSLLDFQLERLNDAKRLLGMGSEHAAKLEGLTEEFRKKESLIQAQTAAGGEGIGGGGSSRFPHEGVPTGGGMPTGGGTPAAARACPAQGNPSGNGSGLKNLDQLSPIHDAMIQMIQLAFEWDLTRVVAFTLSGASSGQTWPSRGVNEYHHGLEHSNKFAQLKTIGGYYSEKFANLLTGLKGIQDPDGKSALYNSSIILGMECDGTNGHSTRNIPFVFAGQGGGKFQTGRVVDAGGRSNNDLLISVQQAAGIQSNTFGLASLCRGPIL